MGDPPSGADAAPRRAPRTPERCQGPGWCVEWDNDEKRFYYFSTTNLGDWEWELPESGQGPPQDPAASARHP